MTTSGLTLLTICDYEGADMLEFSDDFFEGEEIDGFYVQPVLKRCWAATMELLSIIDSICKRHGIIYFADWGTLLGAIRHKGYIPWDDDMDITMTRINYEKFIKVASNELPEYCKLDIPYTFIDHLMRVIGWDIISTDSDIIARKHGYPYAVGIDIFVIDNMTDDKEELENIGTIWRYMWLFLKAWDNNEKKLTEDKKREFLSAFEEFIGHRLDYSKDIRTQIIFYLDRISSMYFDVDTQYGANAIDVLGNDNDQLIPRYYYEEVIEVPFHNMTIPVPKEYEKYLDIRYKDWRTPIRGTADHTFPYFKPQIDALKRAYVERGWEFPIEYDYIDD